MLFVLRGLFVAVFLGLSLASADPSCSHPRSKLEPKRSKCVLFSGRNNNLVVASILNRLPCPVYMKQMRVVLERMALAALESFYAVPFRGSGYAIFGCC